MKENQNFTSSSKKGGLAPSFKSPGPGSRRGLFLMRPRPMLSCAACGDGPFWHMALRNRAQCVIRPAAVAADRAYVKAPSLALRFGLRAYFHQSGIRFFSFATCFVS